MDYAELLGLVEYMLQSKIITVCYHGPDIDKELQIRHII